MSGEVYASKSLPPSTSFSKWCKMTWNWDVMPSSEQFLQVGRLLSEEASSLEDFNLIIDLEVAKSLSGNELTEMKWPLTIKSLSVELDLSNGVLGDDFPPVDHKIFLAASEMTGSLLRAFYEQLERAKINFDMHPDTIGKLSTQISSHSLKELHYEMIYSDAALSPLVSLFPNLVNLTVHCNPFDFCSTFSSSFSDMQSNTEWALKEVNIEIEFADGNGGGSRREGADWVTSLLKRVPRLSSLSMYLQFHSLSDIDSRGFLNAAMETMGTLKALESLSLQFDSNAFDWQVLLKALSGMDSLMTLELGIVRRDIFQFDCLRDLLAEVKTAQLPLLTTIKLMMSASTAEVLLMACSGEPLLTGDGRRVECSTAGNSNHIISLKIASK